VAIFDGVEWVTHEMLHIQFPVLYLFGSCQSFIGNVKLFYVIDIL